MAGALKGYELATVPTIGTGFFGSRVFHTIWVEVELVFGVWLLSGLYPGATRVAAVSLLTVFIAVSLFKALSGSASCGCFGTVPVNPWLTAAIDLVILLLYLLWRPDEVSRPKVTTHPAQFRAFVCLSLLFGVAAAWAPNRLSVAEVAADGDFIGSSDIVVLEPHKWVGSAFPLLNHVDGAEQLRKGKWVVLLYHHDCPLCQQEIDRYENAARESPRGADTPRLALIELPRASAAGGGATVQTSLGLAGRLTTAKKWYAKTPAVLRVEDGVVVALERTGQETR